MDLKKIKKMLIKQKHNLLLGILTFGLGGYLSYSTLINQKIRAWPVVFGLKFYDNIKNAILINGVGLFTLLWIFLTCYLIFEFGRYKIKHIIISWFSILLLHAILATIHSLYNNILLAFSTGLLGVLISFAIAYLIFTKEC